MKVFITAGIGDFLAICSFITEQERQEVTEIYYASRAEKGIRQFIPFMFPNIKQQITVCDEFTPSEEINKHPWRKDLVDRFCVHSLDDLVDRFPLKVPPKDLAGCHDWSLTPMVNAAVNGKRKYRYPREIMEVPLAPEVESFPFPYVCIHPWSDNQRYPERDLSLQECEKLTAHLEKNKMHAVIINNSKDNWPIQSDWIIDRNNKFTLLECMEILKKARLGYYGTSSVFSVLAAKKFPPANLLIKAAVEMRNGAWHKFYYAPHIFNHFIHENLLWL